ncbi:TonB-dependent receptor [Woeseia oceani]|uniref:TonB-dependent receptor n=1 Tax=Woeseia oceani TaxID=1548547 RepID=A0A193LHX6_9GAMM|nr:TonB-dependent receptor [Woeseia oceani]ANO52115.1 TonB-dependent receptor [Woeseia oceani]
MSTNLVFRRTPLALAIGSIVAGAAAPSMAQDSEVRLEEIIVTATRRASSVQDVPYNISAFSGDAMEAALITDQVDLMRAMPGVAVVDRGYRNSGVINGIMIRGVNVDGAALGDYSLSAVPTVSTYVNDTPLYANFVLRDLERVEVLRGPQGTLYGSGSLGGTVRYITRDPKFSEYSGQVNVVGSNVKGSDGNGWSADAIGNFGFSDVAALRINIGHMDYPGLTDYVNVYELDANGIPVAPNGVLDPAASYRNVEDADTVDIDYGRVSFLFEPNDRFKLRAALQAQSDEIGGRRQETVGVDGYGRTYQSYENGSIQLEPSSRDVTLGSLEMEFDLGFATLTSSTSAYDHDGESVSENTGFYAQAGFLAFYYNYPRPMASAVRTYGDRAIVQEFRLVSTTDDPFQYVVGAFYQDQDLDSTQQSFVRGFKTWWDAFLPGLEAVVTGDMDFDYQRGETYEDMSVFGELSYNFTDEFQATVGFRYFDNDFTNTTYVDLPLYAGLFVPETSNFEVKDDDVLFKLNASWDATENSTIYGTVSEGYRRGGANAVPTSGTFAEDPGWLRYDSDSVINYELGIKSTFERTRLSAAVFYVDWDDPQVNTATTNWGFFSVQNGESASSSGLELELDGVVNDYFEYRLGYAYVNAELDEPLFAPDNPTVPRALAGAQLPGTPEHALNATGIFTKDLSADRQWITRVHAYYQSETRNAINDTPTFNVELDAFTLVDISTTLMLSNWDATLFIRNVGNERGVTGLFTEAYMGTAPASGYFGNGSKQFLSQPRTIGVSVNYRF